MYSYCSCALVNLCHLNLNCFELFCFIDALTAKRKRTLDDSTDEGPVSKRLRTDSPVNTVGTRQCNMTLINFW